MKDEIRRSRVMRKSRLRSRSDQGVIEQVFFVRKQVKRSREATGRLEMVYDPLAGNMPRKQAWSHWEKR